MPDRDRDFERNYDRGITGDERRRRSSITGQSESDRGEFGGLSNQQSRYADSDINYRGNLNRRDDEDIRGRNRNYARDPERNAFDVQPVMPDPYLSGDFTGSRRYYGWNDTSYQPGYLRGGGEPGSFGDSQTQSTRRYTEQTGSRASEQTSNRGPISRTEQNRGQSSQYDRDRSWQSTENRDWDQDREDLGILCRDLMTRDVTTVGRENSLREAAELMKDEDCGSLPVVENGRLVGIITDRDIVVRALAEGGDFATLKVSNVMSADLVTCRPTDRAVDALRKMSQSQVRRLPIIDNSGRLRGIVALGDIAVEVERDQELANAVKHISQPSRY